MDKVKIGIVGAGSNASGHARYYHTGSKAEVVAVADPVWEACETLAAEVDARAVSDYTEFLAEVDAVVVASPNFLHMEQVETAAAAGKHIYCEKPMGLNLVEARRIAEAIRAAGVRGAIGFSVSGTAPVQTLLAEKQSGRLGEVHSIWSRRMTGGSQPHRGWRAKTESSGGLLYEINIHELDWMLRAGGGLESVYARFHAKEPDSPRANEQIALVLNFTNRAIGLHQGSYRSAAKSYMRGIEGDLAAAHTDFWGQEVYRATMGSDQPETLALLPPVDVRDNFLEGILNGTPLFNDFEWGLKVMTAAEALCVSAEENRVVHMNEEMFAEVSA